MATRTPARAPAKAAKPKAAKATKGKKGGSLVNHIALVVDRSGSMGSIRGQVISVFNKQLATIQANSRKSGQETFVSLYTFHSSVDKPQYFCKQAQAVPKLSTKTYKLGGSTALLDGCGRCITDLQKAKGAKNDTTSFLIIVITDGEENASTKFNAKKLTALIKDVQKSGRWSLAFLTPKSGVKTLQKFGIPAGNIQDWSATSKGAEEMGRRIVRGLDTFYAARGQGQKAVGNFFTADMTNVSAKDVQGSLSDSTGDFHVWPIASDSVIKSFVETKNPKKVYEKGKGYYELTKPETVQEQKGLAIMDLSTKHIYEGQAARAMLGLPYSGKIKVKPGAHGGFSIFIMSTSLNRVLVKGTTLLYRKT
jgi:hypothetical protein